MFVPMFVSYFLLFGAMAAAYPGETAWLVSVLVVIRLRKMW
jgi:hypothetical protein